MSSETNSAVMTVPIYAVTTVVTLALGYSADHTGQKAYHVAGCSALAVVSFVICAAVDRMAVRYAFICFGFAGVQASVPLLISWEITMFPGRERRAVSVPVINGFGEFFLFFLSFFFCLYIPLKRYIGNLASVYGSFIWPAEDAPRYITGFAVMTAFMLIAGATALLVKRIWDDKGLERIDYGAQQSTDQK